MVLLFFATLLSASFVMFKSLFFDVMNVMHYMFYYSSGASYQTDCFGYLWGIGARWSGSGDRGCVSTFIVHFIQE